MTVKRFTLIVLLLILIISTPAFSKERVAVLDFEAKDITVSDAMAIADLFRSDLVATGEFIVLERGNMQSILNEHELQLKGLTNDASASEIGELLAVNYLFMGNLSKFGNKFILVIDKINVETGEIEKSIKKNAVNMDDFLELSADAAFEMTGAENSNENLAAATNYDAATLTEYIEQIGLFHFLELTSLDVNIKMIQATDVEMRRELYSEYELDNSIVAMLVNLVTFGVGGNFMQGFNELGIASLATTTLFGTGIASYALSNGPTPWFFISGVLYLVTYGTSLISPFLYEAEYNQYLRDTLLVY